MDIVLDRNMGPLILEINARPGLAIQIANQSGLQERLDKVEALDSIPDNPKDRVALTLALFGKPEPVADATASPLEEPAVAEPAPPTE